MIQIITCKFPAPTDADIVMEDPTSPTGEKIIPVPELEHRKSDISKVPSSHPLLPTVHHCLRDQDKERPSASHLCQSLADLKASSAYEESKRERQQQMAMLQESTALLKAQQRKVTELEQELEKEKQRVQELVTKQKQLQALEQLKKRKMAQHASCIAQHASCMTYIHTIMDAVLE